jgi:hypothetical protein
MRRVWFWAPCWYWHGWRTLLPASLGGDEYGRRTLMLGWTVTGRVIVAISRPGRLYPPEAWEHEAGGVLARVFVRRAGARITLTLLDTPGQPWVEAHIPPDEVGGLVGLLAASRSVAWHDPRDADEPSPGAG